MSLRAWARGESGDYAVIEGDGGRTWSRDGAVFQVLNEEGILVDQARVMTHPGLPAVEGQGILVYKENPHATRNYVYDIARKTDSSVIRTVGSSVLVQTAQLDEDVVVSEVWIGSDSLASTFAEMFRQFHLFWTTPLGPGETITWEPLDISIKRYDVRILNVQLGGIDIEYREIRENLLSSTDALLNQQLTVQFKIERMTTMAMGSMTLEGA